MLHGAASGFVGQSFGPCTTRACADLQHVPESASSQYFPNACTSKCVNHQLWQTDLKDGEAVLQPTRCTELLLFREGCANTQLLHNALTLLEVVFSILWSCHLFSQLWLCMSMCCLPFPFSLLSSPSLNTCHSTLSQHAADVLLGSSAIYLGQGTHTPESQTILLNHECTHRC